MTKSRDLIDTGINDLETDIFGRQQPNAVTLSSLNAVAASDEKSGSLLIRTKDGDEVVLVLRVFARSKRLNNLISKRRHLRSNQAVVASKETIFQRHTNNKLRTNTMSEAVLAFH